MPITVRTATGAITLDLSYRVLRIGEVTTIYTTPDPPAPDSEDSVLNGATMNTFTLNG